MKGESITEKLKKDGFVEITSIIVRYAETDMMGVAHHSAYVIWAEEGRSEYMRKAGLPYSKLEKMGISLPVVRLEIKYLKPALYEDRIKIFMKVDVKKRKVVMEFVMVRENEVIARGKTIHIPVSAQGLIPTALPEPIQKSLQKI